MTNEIAKHIGQLLSLQGEDLNFFLSKFERISLKKGDYFIREGEINKKVGFIISGSMISSYNKNGEEIIDEFSLDKEFITDCFSFLTHSQSEKDIKCLEDTELIVISYKEMQMLYSQNPVFERAGRLMGEIRFINKQQKEKSLKLDNAEIRYLKLVKIRPCLFQKIPQYLIASYLNIRPETLSRIRKKLLLK